MRLITRGRRAPLHTNTTLQLPASTRTQAIGWLREKILAGDAGLDVYDPSIFILKLQSFERVWGYRAVELAGAVLSRSDDGHGGRRLRGILEADVRQALGLDELGDRPFIADEPLASRGVDVAPGPLFVRPVPLVLVETIDPEPSSMKAMREARAAYDRRRTDKEVS